MIRFACWGCSKIMKAAEAAAGKQAKCPRCSRVVQIPTLEVAKLQREATRDPPQEIDYQAQLSVQAESDSEEVEQVTDYRPGDLRREAEPFFYTFLHALCVVNIVGPILFGLLILAATGKVLADPEAPPVGILLWLYGMASFMPWLAMYFTGWCLILVIADVAKTLRRMHQSKP